MTDKLKQAVKQKELTRDTVEVQFCSDWLKQEILKLFDENARLLDENRTLKGKVKHLYGLIRSEMS